MSQFSPLRRLAAGHPILGLLFVNGLAGALAGVIVACGLILLDIGGIGRLVARSDTPMLPFGLMLFGFVITLSSVAMGAAVMRIGVEVAGRGPERHGNR